MAKRVNWRTITARIEKEAKLALIYADDGALRTAARVLNELAADVLKAAEAKDRALNRYITDFNRRTDEINAANGHN